MQSFDGISFLWAVALLAVIAAFYGLQAVIGYRNVARDAEEDYDYRQPQGMIDKRLSRDDYIKTYRRVHNPRRPAYVATSVVLILALTWPAMAVIGFALEQLYQFTGRSRVFEPGFLVWQFSIFFAVIMIWASIGYSMARRYHRRTPGTFQYEIEQELKEIQTGSRDSVKYENDFGLPPFIVIGAVFLTFIAALMKFGRGLL